MVVIGSNRRDRRGATAVEFPLVTPVFFLRVLGFFEIGRVCMVTELLTEAARRACLQSVIEDNQFHRHPAGGNRLSDQRGH